MSAGVEVRGADEAAGALHAIAADAHRQADANATLAAVGADAIRSAEPSRTGALRGSTDASSDEGSAAVTIGVPYWPFQDRGTRYVRARRFVERGAAAMAARAPDVYAAGMARSIERRT